jgi:hypothetical protein
MNADAYRRVVAAAYDVAPTLVMRDVFAWELLASETLAHYRELTRWLTVVPVNDPEPYATVEGMFGDIGRNRLLVSDVNHEHPVWTPEVNRAFRVVHDVCGHWQTGSDFSWEGELRAYRAHDRITGGIQARHALFTEAVGQVASALVNGAFGAQKVACLPQWMFWALDDVLATVQPVYCVA